MELPVPVPVLRSPRNWRVRLQRRTESTEELGGLSGSPSTPRKGDDSVVQKLSALSFMYSGNKSETDVPRSPEEMARCWRIVKELETTERTFGECLDSALRLFYEPLKSKVGTPHQLLNEEALEGIFSPLPELARIQKIFFEELCNLLSKQRAERADDFPSIGPFMSGWVKKVSRSPCPVLSRFSLLLKIQED